MNIVGVKLNNNGKVYLAIENDKAIGLIMGTIIKYDPNDYLDYTCPKAGEITELIISSNARGKSIGQRLMNKLEELIITTETNRDKLYETYGVESNNDMTEKQLKNAIEILEKRVK